MNKAIILLSGGIDSAVLLALANRKRLDCITLSFNYGQRNAKEELNAAKALSVHYNAEHIQLTLAIPNRSHSSLINSELDVPKDRSIEEVYSSETPSTYVPGRNTLFLSYALSLAEAEKAESIYFGCMGEDNAYPDCRSEYVEAMQDVFSKALTYKGPKLETPLLPLSKEQILKEALSLKLPLEHTFSCYAPLLDGSPCELCDACQRRSEGFKQLGVEDPLLNLQPLLS